MLAKAEASGDGERALGEPADRRALLATKRTGLGKGPELHSVTDLNIPVEGGEIKARLYRPGPDPAGVLVYLHGGGWVVGCIEDFDALARTLAARSGCLVLLPEYRLAPEHPFPTGLEDAKQSMRFAQSTICRTDRKHLPMIIAGDSAGGNLATVAASELAGEIDIAAQVLIYPVTDCDMETESYCSFATGYTLTKDDMMWFFGHYAPDGERSSMRIAPLRNEDLSKRPPTFLATAQYDVLCSEGEAYSRLLGIAGVPVTYRCYAGLAHGFVRLHNLLDVADNALTEIADFVVAHCGPAKAG